MYTVSKGPSKIVAKTRRGLTQNYEKFETIKESSKRCPSLNSPEKNIVPRPVFQTNKRFQAYKQVEEDIITPQHEEIINYINESWNIVVAQNPYDSATLINGNANARTQTPEINSISPPTAPATLLTGSLQSPTNSMYCVEPPSPVLNDFKPFDLESWWGRRLFNSITKSL